MASKEQGKRRPESSSAIRPESSSTSRHQSSSSHQSSDYTRGHPSPHFEEHRGSHQSDSSDSYRKSSNRNSTHILQQRDSTSSKQHQSTSTHHQSSSSHAPSSSSNNQSSSSHAPSSSSNNQSTSSHAPSSSSHAQSSSSINQSTSSQDQSSSTQLEYQFPKPSVPQSRRAANKQISTPIRNTTASSTNADEAMPSNLPIQKQWHQIPKKSAATAEKPPQPKIPSDWRPESTDLLEYKTKLGSGSYGQMWLAEYTMGYVKVHTISSTTPEIGIITWQIPTFSQAKQGL